MVLQQGKRGERAELGLNLIEITIPWNDSIINEGKFQKGSNEKYILEPFKKEDRSSNTLTDAREEES
jgi:hypothetical protein